MDSNLKKKWIDALHSCKYKQGKNHLRNKKDQFCCLGVLCDVYNPDGWIFIEARGIYAFEGGRNIAPSHLIEFTGTKDCPQGAFIRMNDTTGLNFDQIADYIEDTL